MGSISKEITVGASLAHVYKFVSDPHNAPRYISAIRRIESGPSGAPAEGQVWKAEAELLGKVRNISLKLDELRPDRQVRYTISGDPSVEITLRLRPDGAKGTEVELTADSPSFPSLLMNAVLGNMLAGDLRRLKAILESA